MAKATKEELDRRVVLIRQAIARGAGRFFGGAKLLYPISDYILLAFQTPACFSIWTRSGKLVFSTFRDPDIVSTAMLASATHLTDPDNCKIDLSFLGRNLSDYFVTLHTVSKKGFDPVGTKDIAFLKHILNPNQKPHFPDGFSEALQRAIEAHSKYQWIDSDCGIAMPLSDEQVVKYLKPLRSVLDEVIPEILEHQSFSVTLSSGASVPNIFAVVRTVRSPQKRFSEKEPRGIFPYTASLLLSNVQRDLLPRICDDSVCSACEETTRANCEQKQYMTRCISLLEAPLSLKARSIFDSVYYSGCVDFGLMGKTGEAGQWRDRGGAGEDILRREVEKCVYGVLTRGNRSRIMYVPIHVGGSPWISLFTFTRADDESTWDDNYCFYRDIISKLSDRIRSAVQATYIKALVNDLRDAVDRRNDIVGEIDGNWGVASQIFPFRRHRLIQCTASTSGALRLPLGIHAVLSEEDNPFCHAQIDYGHIVLERLRDSLSKELQLMELIELRTNEEVRNRLTSHTHTFRNLLHGLTGTLDDAHRASDLTTARRYCRDATSYTDKLDVSLKAALDLPPPPTFPRDIKSMLFWMCERTPSRKVTPKVSCNKSAKPRPFPTTEAQYSAFTILWNLWDNAEKVAGGEQDGWFRVSMKKIEGERCIQIDFTNLGQMSEPWRDYLNDRGSSPNTEPRRRGLEIVKELIPLLGWTIHCDVTKPRITCIRLLIPLDAAGHLDNRRRLNAQDPNGR